MISMVPVADINMLHISWQLPNMDKYYLNKPLEYINSLLGHESEGSIYSVLKSNGWGNSLTAGIFNNDDSIFLYMVTIELTDLGWNYIPIIIGMVYIYIDIIKSSIDKWRYDELKTTNEMIFKYIDKDEHIDYVSMLSSYMLKYPIQYVISADYIYKPYTDKTKKLIQKCLSYMHEENSIVILNSKKNKLKNPIKEQYYGITYTITDGLKYKTSDMPLFLPKKNLYISSADLLTESKNKYPKKVKHPYMEVWFKKNNKFLIPKIMSHTYVYMPQIYKNCKNVIISNMYIRLYNHIMRSDLYYLNSANSTLQITLHENYICIHMDVYSDVIDTILDKFVAKLVDIDITKNIFDIVKKQYKKDIQNYIYNTPLVHSSEYLKEKTYYRYYTYQNLLSVMNNVDIKDVLTFRSWLSNNRVKMFVYGNIDKVDDIISYFDKFGSINSQKFVYSDRVDGICDGEIELYMKKVINPQEKDNFIHVYYEIGNIKIKITPDWDKLIFSLMLIHKMSVERFFDTLRTEQQTGYIVKSFISTLGNVEYPVYGLSFIVQSYKKQPHKLRSKIKSFIKNTSTYIKSLSTYKYDQYVHILRSDLLKKDTNRNEEYTKYNNVILDGTYLFDIHKHLASIKITQKELAKIYDRYFINKDTRKMRIIEFYKDLFIPKL
jgi:secreted Zn-dependent insulinase-like peptidase